MSEKKANLTERYRAIKPKKSSGDMPLVARPTLHLSFQDLPAAKNWKVGETYEVSLKLKQISMHKDTTGGGAAFEIIGIDEP